MVLCRLNLVHVGTVLGVCVHVHDPSVAEAGLVCVVWMPWVEESSREELLHLPAGKGQFHQHLATAAVLC